MRKSESKHKRVNVCNVEDKEKIRSLRRKVLILMFPFESFYDLIQLANFSKSRPEKQNYLSWRKSQLLTFYWNLLSYQGPQLFQSALPRVQN